MRGPRFQMPDQGIQDRFVRDVELFSATGHDLGPSIALGDRRFHIAIDFCFDRNGHAINNVNI